MIIKINEHQISFTDKLSLFQVKERLKPNADVIIYNGFPVVKDCLLKDGDEINLIKKGEIPSKKELESLIVSRHSPGIHQKLKTAIVGIAGLGGLGSSVAIALARTGIGKLIIVDFDIIEPSNLNRQQYFVHQIGEFKTEAMYNNLKLINPYVDVKSYNIKINEDNLNNIFQEAMILIEAFDLPEMKSMLVNSFFKFYPDRFVISASGLAGYEDANKIKTKRLGNLFLVGDNVSAAKPGCGLMAPRVGISAHHQANKVLEIILGVVL